MEEDEIQIIDPFVENPELFTQKIRDPQDNTDDLEATQGSNIASEEGDRIGSQMYEGMSFEDAVKEFKRLKELPNVEEQTFSPNLVYTDVNTGRREIILPPQPRMLKAAGKAIVQAVQAPFSDEVSLKDAADTFTNPEAKIGGMDLFSAGVQESVGDAVETGAALMGNDEAVERIARDSVSIDTEDSITDSLIADGGPALVSALIGDKGASKVLKYGPKALRAIGRLIVGDTTSTLTTGTEDGTFLVGEDAIIPVWDGLDLGDSASQQVLDQRVNTLIEGLAGASLISGAARTAAGTGKLAYDLTLAPIVSLFSEGSKEKRIYNDIMGRLAQITDASTPEEIFQVQKNITDIIEANKDISFPMLNNIAEDDTLTLDAMSAYLKGIQDPKLKVKAQEIIAGMQTKNMPRFAEAIQKPQTQLDEEMQSYLSSIDAETPSAQTAAMDDVAEEFTGQANQYLDEATGGAARAQEAYDQAVERLGTGISEDLEFASRLKQLEKITGTDISKAKRGKLDDVMAGVRMGYEDLKTQKDLLYSQLEGGDIDVESIFNKFADLNEDQLSAAAAQVRNSNPVANFLKVFKVKQVKDVDPTTGAEVMREATADDHLELFKELLEGQGADFGYFYKTIRPELSAVAGVLFNSDTGKGAGAAIRDIVKFIDGDMVDFVGQADAGLAQQAKEAKDFAQNQFYPIFGGEGVMADYANLHNRTIGRTAADDLTKQVDGTEFDRSGYDQGLERLTGDVLSGGNVAATEQMAKALEVASDPEAMADFMVLDVLDKYATDIRVKGLDSVNLTGMSKDLQSYADQLNEVFPEKARQITTFIFQIEEAAKGKGNLDAIITTTGDAAKQARDDIAQTELMGFLRTELGNEGYLPTSNSQEAFRQLFTNKEGLAKISNIMMSAEALPPGRSGLVKRGVEVAYMRQFREAIKGRKVEIGGGFNTKDASLQRSQEEYNQLFRIGREIFKDKPEVIDSLETLSEAAGMVERNKGARPNASMSPTAFNQEATTATNRLIFTFIGPLSRVGTRVRAGSSAIMQKLDATGEAEKMMDKILADPEYFVELSRKYNTQPNNKTNQDLLTRFLITSGMRTTATTDYEDRPDLMNTALDAAADKVGDVNEAVDMLDQQMNELELQ